MNKLIYILVISLILLSSCQTGKDMDNGIDYTEYINKQDLNKLVIETYPNGQEKSIIFYDKEDNKQTSVKEIHFFEDGTIQVEGTLKNKKRHGIWTFYHKNGKVWSKGEFDMGKSVGVFNIYDEKGQIKIKSYYENNNKIKEDYFINGEFYKSVDLPQKK